MEALFDTSCKVPGVPARLPSSRNPHHPGASDPTTPALRATPPRRGGERVFFACPPRGGGRDATVSRTGGPAALRTPPPRRCAPPLLDEEGSVFSLPALLVEEGGTRQCRGQVVETGPKPHHPGTS